MRPSKRHNRRAGFSLLELTIGFGILSLLMLTLTLVLNSASSITRSGSIAARLEEEGRTALAEITRTLGRSGFASTDATHSYPYLFADGAPDQAEFAQHAHDPAVQHGEPGDPDQGFSREIVLLLPRDDDDGDPLNGIAPDGRPDLTPGGMLDWSAVETSFVLVTGADGINVLQRRLDGAAPRVVSRNVERIVFDTSAEEPVDVPVNCVRVRLWLRATDQRGAVHRTRVESVVRLRNG